MLRWYWETSWKKNPLCSLNRTITSTCPTQSVTSPSYFLHLHSKQCFIFNIHFPCILSSAIYFLFFFCCLPLHLPHWYGWLLVRMQKVQLNTPQASVSCVYYLIIQYKKTLRSNISFHTDVSPVSSQFSNPNRCHVIRRGTPQLIKMLPHEASRTSTGEKIKANQRFSPFPSFPVQI